MILVFQGTTTEDSFSLRPVAKPVDSNLQSELDTRKASQSKISTNVTDLSAQKPVEITANKSSLNTRGTFGDLPLPDPPVLDMPDSMLGYMTSLVLLFDKQDELYRKRVPYSDIALKTQESLKSQLSDLQKEIVPKLIEYAHNQQKSYWSAGDLNSDDAYKFCYAAQAAVELALSINPNDPMLYEELAEIIGAGHPLDTVLLEKGKPRNQNFSIVKQLIEIRSKQLVLYEKSEQVWPHHKNRISPVFKALMELAYLHSLTRDTDAVSECFKKAEQWAERGKWSDMGNILGIHAITVQTNPSQVLPTEVLKLAWQERFTEGRLESIKTATSITDGAFLKLVRPFLRRGPFFEGPLYLEHVASHFEDGSQI